MKSNLSIPTTVLALALLACAVPQDGMAQNAPTDILTLDTVRRATTVQDARSIQPGILEQASELRLGSLRAARMPRVALSGQATIQSDVPGIPVSIPGQSLPVVPKEQFRTGLDAEFLLYDGQRTKRQTAAERARLAQDLAGVAVSTNQLRNMATETFFSARLLDARYETLELAATDIGSQLERVTRQVQEGAALATHADVLRAERIRVEQQMAEVAAYRRSARTVLSQLTGLIVTESTVLAASDHNIPPPAGSYSIQRPELTQLARAAERAEADAAARAAENRPTVSLFGQAGVGRPNAYNFFSTDASEYGMAGIRLKWSLFDGGRIRKQAHAMRLQASLAASESEAFRDQVHRSVSADRETLSFLTSALESDRQIVELRERVLDVARTQLDEGVLLPDAYTDRVTDLANARLDLARHEIEREQTQARILSTLGILDK